MKPGPKDEAGPTGRRTDELDSWLRQRSVWRCVERLAAGLPVPAPLSVELHLGTECNLACPECVSRPILGTARFDTERALSVAGDLADLGVRSVVLSGGGEPLLHPSAGGVLRLLAEAGVAVALVTNGTRLRRHLDVVADCAARVRVSVDAADGATHARFRPHRSGRDVFARILEGMEALAARRPDRLTFSFLLLSRESALSGDVESNVGSIAAAARLAQDLGCGTFEVNVAFDERLRVARAHRLVARALAEQLARAAELDGPTFRVHIGPLAAEIARGGPASALPRPSYSRCPAAEIHALVGPLGVSLCARHQGLPDARYGDPVATSLGDIWASPAHAAALDRVDPRVHCEGVCMAAGINEKLLRALDLARRPGFEPALTPDHDLFM